MKYKGRRIVRNQRRRVPDPKPTVVRTLLRFAGILLVSLTVGTIFTSMQLGFQYQEAYISFDASFENGVVRERRLGDGCYHVFLDVGANRGNHGRFLLEPEQYPLAKRSRKIFDEQYGQDRDNRDLCVFEFEANPRHWPYLQNISLAYHRMGWRYHVVEAAVSDFDGNSTFYHERAKQSPHKIEVQFSGAKYKDGKDSKRRWKWKEEVPTIRLSKWIQYHILERKVPSHPPSKTTTDHNDRPFLSMKMDIESFEFIVLPDLITFNSICNFDLVFGEFHNDWAPFQFEPVEGLRDIRLESPEAAMNLESSIIQLIHATRQCKVRFQKSDDETYMIDNTPLPNP